MASDPKPLDDVKIVKTELFDVDAMMMLANHDSIASDVKKLLKSYRKNRVNGNEVQVVYNHGKSLKGAGIGRVYPDKGLGLQAFPSDVRAALAHKYYWDIDMVNAQPTLLVNLAEKEGWACSALKDYVKNRSAKLQEIMYYFNCDRDDAKEICLSILFGKKFKQLPDFLKELTVELERISANISNANPSIFKLCSKKTNPRASCTAYVVQHLEAQILRFIDLKLKEKGRDMRVYIHDGGLVIRLEGEAEFPKDILRSLETEILMEFDVKITLDQKPMAHTFVLKNDVLRFDFVTELQYQAKKELFEEDHFYCQGTSTICWSQEDGSLTHTKKGDCSISFASYNFQKTIDGKIHTADFCNEWLRDPKKRVVKGLTFEPSTTESKENMFNLFRGLESSKVVECPESDAVVDRFKLLLFHNAGKNEELNTYMLKWFAHLVQYPHIVPGVALILINTDQGTGKETLSEFVGRKIIGGSYYRNIKNVETELFDAHSDALDKTLFLKLEEVNGSVNRKLCDQIKGLVTATSATVNPKGIAKYNIDAFPHIVMTTNNPVPVRVEPSDRRFCISYTSSDFVGQTTFWEETYRLLGLPGAGHAVFKMLMGVDLSGFKVKDFVKTEYHQNLSATERPSEELFISKSRKFTDVKATSLYNHYTLYCQKNQLVAKNMQHFARALSPLIERKILIRRMKDGYSLYSKLVDPVVSSESEELEDDDLIAS